MSPPPPRSVSVSPPPPRSVSVSPPPQVCQCESPPPPPRSVSVSPPPPPGLSESSAKSSTSSLLRLSRTGRSRNGTSRSRRAMPGSFTFGSGVSETGWMLLLMTDCPPPTGRSSTATLTTVTSSGARWWRKPMPSDYHKLNET